MDYSQVERDLKELSQFYNYLITQAEKKITQQGVTIEKFLLSRCKEELQKNIITYPKVKMFLQKERPLYSAKVLNLLCTVFDAKQYSINDIGQLINAIPENMRTAALYSEDVIENYIYIIDLYKKLTKERQISPKVFAKAFGENADDIAQIIIRAQKNVLKKWDTQNNESMEHVMETITDDSFIEHVLIYQNQEDQRVEQKKDALKRVLGELFPELSSIEIAQKIGMSIHKMRNAVRETRPIESCIDQVLEKIEQWQEGVQEETAQEDPSVPLETIYNKQSQVQTPQIVLTQENLSQYIAVLGGQEVNGVRFVLTPEHMLRLEISYTEDFLKLLQKQIILTRSLLNMLPHNINVQEHERLVKALGREFEALYLALEVAASEIPSNVMEIYEAQRRDWNTKNTKGGKK